MALIVEDGTGKDDAESYVSVAQADSHHLARGAADWATLSTDEKEQALRRATDYMVQSYRPRWRGSRKTSTQSLDWPRTSVTLSDAESVGDDVVPAAVRAACAELALRAAAGPLLSDAGRETLSETVGELSVTYRAGTSRQTVYEAIERMLRPYLVGGLHQVQVVRS